ncbi:MAG: SDR family NAD(P)-dependent oxidoreductase, partial [Chitinophagaceae bacterium]
MTNIFALTGKNVLITGGGSGLGLAISKAMIDAGARVMIVGRREDVLQQACKSLGERSVYKVFDIAILENIPGFVSEVESNLGPVHVLVNNAGINMKKDFHQVTDADFESVMRINQQAAFALSREFSRKMVERKSGTI